MDDEEVDAGLLYGDDRETRVFDFHRYELSKQLPTIIEELEASANAFIPAMTISFPQ